MRSDLSIFAFRLLLASPPHYYVLHNYNVATLFGFSVAIGFVIALTARKHIPPLGCAVGLVLAGMFLLPFLQHNELLQLATNEHAIKYIASNMLMLLVMTTCLTWLVCWDAARLERNKIGNAVKKKGDSVRHQ